MSKMKGQGKTSKPCLTQEVIHKLCVKTEMQKYADGRSVHQHLIFLAAPHSMYHLSTGPAFK